MEKPMCANRIYAPIHDIKWSGAEKLVARNAFKNAYSRECKAIQAKLEKMIATASAPSGLWKIHDYLSEQRNQTDEKYDYRYSVLVFVFAKLLNEGWLQENELKGIGEEKMEQIRMAASL